MLPAMQTLFGILGDSFLIWSRNISLVYILLLLSLVISLVFPQSEVPSWEWRWIALFSVLLLLVAAFMAGWFGMIRKACVRYFEQNRETMNPTDLALEGFTLFSGFLPGIARYFPSVVVGVLIQAMVVLGLFLMVQPVWAQNSALLEQVFKQASQGRQEVEAIVRSLTPAQLGQLNEFFLVLMTALLIYVGFYLLTMLWPAFLVLYNESAVKAYWRSITQFFKDPFALLLLWALFLSTQFVLHLLTVALPTLLAAIFQLLGLMVEVYMGVVLFVYACHKVGKPVNASEELVSDAAEEPPSDE